VKIISGTCAHAAKAELFAPTDPVPSKCSFFMYRRPILCTLYGAVDFLNVLKKGCWVGGGGGVLLVCNEIHYVPIGLFGRSTGT
jgi:hypothetical protein